MGGISYLYQSYYPPKADSLRLVQRVPLTRRVAWVFGFLGFQGFVHKAPLDCTPQVKVYIALSGKDPNKVPGRRLESFVWPEPRLRREKPSSGHASVPAADVQRAKEHPSFAFFGIH